MAAYTSPPEAANRIINAMGFLQNTLGEECRFDSFVRMMASSCRSIRAAGTSPETASRSVSLVVDGMIFVNAILENLDDTEVRIHIRNQIYRRPFRSEFEALKESKEPAIDRQCSVFNALLQSDAQWLMGQYNRPDHYFSNPADLFGILLESVKGSEGVAATTNLLQHILCVRADAGVRTRYIRLLDRTLEQILLVNRGIDPDFAASPTPYFTAKELEAILNTTEVDALKQENMRLRFEVASVGDAKKQLAEKSAEYDVLLREVGEARGEADFLRDQARTQADAARSKIEEVSASLGDELGRARERIAQLEAQVPFLASSPDLTGSSAARPR